MSRLDQKLLHRLATKKGKPVKYIREQASRRASRESISSEIALIRLASDAGIGTAAAIRGLDPTIISQLSMPSTWSRPKTAASRERRMTFKTRTGPLDERKRKMVPARRTVKARYTVFLSHSSADKALAKALVELLLLALNLKSKEILCTSLDGFRLDGGDNTEKALRDYIVSSPVFIGLITASSHKSAYVLFECGARWGQRKRIIPLVAGGFLASDLPGPMGGMNGLDCGEDGQLHQLIGQISTAIKRQRDQESAFVGKLKSLSAMSRRLKSKNSRRP